MKRYYVDKYILSIRFEEVKNINIKLNLGSYFDTWQEAREYLKARSIKEITLAEKALKSAKNKLMRCEKMKAPK